VRLAPVSRSTEFHGQIGLTRTAASSDVASPRTAIYSNLGYITSCVGRDTGAIAPGPGPRTVVPSNCSNPRTAAFSNMVTPLGLSVITIRISSDSLGRDTGAFSTRVPVPGVSHPRLNWPDFILCSQCDRYNLKFSTVTCTFLTSVKSCRPMRNS